MITNSFIGEGVVVVLPGELGLDVSARSQALASFDDLQVGDFVEVKRLGALKSFFATRIPSMN